MVYLFLADGFEEIEALTPVDVLRRAGVSVTTVGIGGDVIRGSHGIEVHADMPDVMYRDSRPEMIILPGGMPGTKNLDASSTVDSALKAAEKSGAWIGAICAAPMVLGKRGILKGHRAVCYPGFEGYLEGAVLEGFEQSKVVIDGRIITAAGMGVALNFALALTKNLCGEEKAEQIRKSIIAY